VRALATQFTQRYQHLDVLINNAGLAAPERHLTEDGIESNFAVNVVAPWLLSRLLLLALQASAAARIVTLTGGSHPARIELDNLQAERTFAGLNTYSHAKLLMMAVMYEFAERVRGTSVTINVCYPGQASTTMTQQVTPAMLSGALRLFWPLFKWATRPDNGASAQRASRSSVYLALSPDVAGMSAIYVDARCKTASWPPAVRDVTVRRHLWAYLEGLIHDVESSEESSHAHQEASS
jgi:NAD(P)-dependent dehydrogenase (short-subunit alcohol dehydrogenase family)